LDGGPSVMHLGVCQQQAKCRFWPRVTCSTVWPWGYDLLITTQVRKSERVMREQLIKQVALMADYFNEVGAALSPIARITLSFPSPAWVSLLCALRRNSRSAGLGQPDGGRSTIACWRHIRRRLITTQALSTGFSRLRGSSLSRRTLALDLRRGSYDRPGFR